METKTIASKMTDKNTALIFVFKENDKYKKAKKSKMANNAVLLPDKNIFISINTAPAKKRIEKNLFLKKHNNDFFVPDLNKKKNDSNNPNNCPQDNGCRVVPLILPSNIPRVSFKKDVEKSNKELYLKFKRSTRGFIFMMYVKIP
jgi:hypothetical protein